VVLNPNHESYTIYPEEITQLLANGAVAIITHEVIDTPRAVLAGTPRGLPKHLIQTLKSLYESLPYVTSARLLGTFPRGVSKEMTLMVCLQVKAPHEERAAHATATTLQASSRPFDFDMDVMTASPDHVPEHYEKGLLIFERDRAAIDNSEIAPGIPTRRTRSGLLS
jgi:hypothetical protein